MKLFIFVQNLFSKINSPGNFTSFKLIHEIYIYMVNKKMMGYYPSYYPM